MPFSKLIERNKHSDLFFVQLAFVCKLYKSKDCYERMRKREHQERTQIQIQNIQNCGVRINQPLLSPYGFIYFRTLTIRTRISCYKCLKLGEWVHALYNYHTYQSDDSTLCVLGIKINISKKSSNVLFKRKQMYFRDYR